MQRLPLPQSWAISLGLCLVRLRRVPSRVVNHAANILRVCAFVDFKVCDGTINFHQVIFSVWVAKRIGVRWRKILPVRFPA
jgi:hypothetical protein